ncbi:MAG: 2-aminoethylphosphonate--pyruvate transaminase [Erysipelotrichaceae bacterium]
MNLKAKKLLTPGPLTTSPSVRAAMNIDLGTRDDEYASIVASIGTKLLKLANANPNEYKCIFLQGSGTYGVEAVLTSSISDKDKVLILANGAYGIRMSQICEHAKKNYTLKSYSMIEQLDLKEIEPLIASNEYTHVAFIHSETTAGILNNLEGIMKLIHKYHKISIVDAMSSFGGVNIDLNNLQIDYLVTSANKCLHGVPGVALIIAKEEQLKRCKGNAVSLSLDLYEQYETMLNNYSFRFTSPTHVMLALNQGIDELINSGGINERNKHYKNLQAYIAKFMKELGFKTLVDENIQCPVITTYLNPEGFDFKKFYDHMKDEGYLLYSGKLADYDAFRIGNIGDLNMDDIKQLENLVRNYREEN